MNPIYRTGWIFYWLLCRIYFRARIYNPERVPRTGPAILASNHASFLDPPFVGASLPRALNYLARENLFHFRVAGWILRRCQAIPVDREGGGARGLKGILDRLLAGGAILLFPEGTRTRDGKLQAARSGIGLAIIKSDAPVIPVRVFGTYEAFGRHLRWPRPKQIQIKFGRELLFRELRDEAKHCSKPRLKQIYQEAADQTMAAIAGLGPFADKETFP